MVSKKLVLSFGLLLGIFLFSFVSAADQCKIDTSANCGQSGWYTLFKLSDSTNAHVSSDLSSTYPYAACCNIAGTIWVSTTSNPGRFMGVSSETNAHAESPSSSGYSTGIYDSGMTCVGATGSCPAGYVSAYSLSSATNAHVGAFADYSTKVCCKSNVVPCTPSCGVKVCGNDGCGGSCGTCSGGTVCNGAGQCVIPPKPWAQWTDADYNTLTSIDYKTTKYVHMVAGNLGLADGAHVTVEIYEHDLIFDDKIRTVSKGNAITATVSGNGINENWFPTFADLGISSDKTDYYFRIVEKNVESGYLSIDVGSNCQLNSASWSQAVSYKGIPVTMDALGTSCVDDGDQVQFITTGILDNLTYPFVSNRMGTISGNEASISFTPNNTGVYHFYAYTTNNNKKSGDLNVEEYNCLAKGATLCSDYTDESSCNFDVCGVSSKSLPAEIDCSLVDCGCSWDSANNVCYGGWNETGIGSCFYNENSNDNCDDGLLTYSWDAVWTWDSINVIVDNSKCVSDPTNYKMDGAVCRYNPGSKSLNCKPGSNSISCPAQAQLPFFTWYNAVIALAVIGLIYIMLTHKKAKTISKKKKRR